MILRTLVLLTTTLLSICAANELLLMPAHGISLLPEERSYNNRHELPQSLKYGETNVFNYNPANSVLQPGPVIPNTYKKIQYAPLDGTISQKNKNSAMEFTKVSPTHSTYVTQTIPTQADIRNPFRKDHLEPRVPSDQPVLEEFKCYNSAPHNTGMASSVSRSPGHNAVYRSFPETVPRERLFKFNYNVRPYEEYHHLEALATTVTPFKLPDEKFAKPFSIPNGHYVLNPNLIEGDSVVMNKIKRQYAPYPKYHRLHLNIARVYSPGQVPVKSPIFTDPYAPNNRRLPVHSEDYVPPAFEPIPDHNTVHYPIKDHVKRYRYD